LNYLGAEFSAVEPSDRVTWRVSFRDSIIETPSGIRFDLRSFDPIVFAETFVYDIHYAGPNLSGKTVIDAGAFVGDTALYYAQRGAEVLAFEPDPTNFRILNANLLLNPAISKRIRTFNAAVGIHGTARFVAGLAAGSRQIARGGTIIQVPMLSIQDVIDECHSGKAFLLKSDCKGSEFEMVQQGALSRIERVQFEYSATLRNKEVADLLGDLEMAGFKIERVFKGTGFHYSLRYNGMVYAVRYP